MLHFRGTTLSAGEVDGLSDAVACALQNRGIRAGHRIGLLLQNDPQFPVCQLGAWKAGATTVPLSPMLTAAELAGQLHDTGCSALICLDELASAGLEAARGAEVEHVALTSPDELAQRAVTRHSGAERLGDWLDGGRVYTPVAVDSRDVAIITFTSGTTGRAKGACITHANVVWSAHVFRDWVDLDEDAVILGAAPLFHVTGQVAHLAVGDLLAAPVVLDHRFDARSLLALADRHEATFLVAAVTAYHALLGARDRSPRSLRRLVGGAQPIAPALVAEVERWSGCYLQNIYGMTETTSPSHAVPHGSRAPVDSVTGALSVGVPVTGTESVIADPDTGRPLPDGTCGEILVRGPQVVPGYWNRADADSEAFHQGWLRTGDLGLRDHRGWFYVVDRIKDLINAAGFKVAPREVEEVLEAHPHVRSAAVVGVPDDYRGETVKAFVVARDAVDVDPDALRAHCRTRLATYKVPREIELVDELPQTATGKVSRHRLR
jgi:long-chain acyl-CoA synthetase